MSTSTIEQLFTSDDPAISVTDVELLAAAVDGWAIAYQPDDDDFDDIDDGVGIEEALVLEECAHQEDRADSMAIVRGLARTEAHGIDRHDLAGMTLIFGDLSACD